MAHCLAKPGAVPDEPWEGDPVAEVGGRIFAFLGDERPGVKRGRDAAELRLRLPEAVSVAPDIGRYGWNTVRLDVRPGPDDDELRELVDASYEAVAAKLPKRLRPWSGGRTSW